MRCDGYFQAATYAEVFDWDKTKMMEPPLTIGLCDSVIQDIFHTPLKVKNYPVHTQAVERAVQVVTEASCKVAGEAQRHGYICNKLKHRKQIPCVASKRSFVEAFTASQLSSASFAAVVCFRKCRYVCTSTMRCQFCVCY